MAKKITCLLVDDEPPALAVLEEYISAVPSLELLGSCTNAVQALGFLQKQNVGLLFLDIQMPQLSGTDFIRTLRNPPKVIFTTAYRQFAIEGFDLNAVDYLLKPIAFERFLKAVNRVLDGPLPETSAYTETPEGGNGGYIFCRSDGKNLKIPLADILYVESLRDYCRIVTQNRLVITKQTISSLESSLPSDSFVRIHRSFIAALNKIHSYTSEIVEIGEHQLPIGRIYRREVGKHLK